MSLTPKETQVVEHLRQQQVTTKTALCQHLDTSPMTVVRALKKVGYYTSYNHNSAYYTLHETPTFDPDGLWFHGDIGFSQHPTLAATLTGLVERAPAGHTAGELRDRLRTEVANLLSLACAHQRLSRFYLGRQAVYVSKYSRQQSRQRRRRQQQAEALAAAAPPLPRPPLGLPPGLDALTVIAVLVDLIERPQARAASRSRRLQAQGRALTASHVRQVLDFYDLGKKGGR